MALKVACVGTSMITKGTIEAISNVEGVEAYAIYSRDMAKAESFGLTKAFDNYAEMLSDDAIDIVYIASPNTLHFTQAKEALLARKHVVLEKPFVQSLAEAEELFSLAEQNACLLFEAITTIHNLSYKQIKERLSELGTLKHFYANYSQYSSRYTKYLAGEISNIFDPNFGGGALSDLNIYNIHLAVGLFGLPVTQQYLPNRGFNGIDTSGLAILSYPTFHALCFGGKDCDGRNGLELQGEKGYLYAKEDSRHLGEIETNLSTLFPTPPHVERIANEWINFTAAIKTPEESDYHLWKNHTLQVMKVYEALKAGL